MAKQTHARREMKSKVILIAAYWVALLAAAGIFGRPAASSFITARKAGQLRSTLVKLNSNGTRGVVYFDHKKHETAVNPDPAALFKTTPGASCSGCHHTTSAQTGIPQLWRCASCHRGGGDVKNPQGTDSSEVWSKTAFHRLCIGCHQASSKGPIKCGDCHRATGQ